ncbi:MAG: hypothetical protein ACREJM_00755 [Candidatus Saccharimonadales bacterium]
MRVFLSRREAITAMVAAWLGYLWFGRSAVAGRPERPTDLVAGTSDVDRGPANAGTSSPTYRFDEQGRLRSVTTATDARERSSATL